MFCFQTLKRNVFTGTNDDVTQSKSVFNNNSANQLSSDPFAISMLLNDTQVRTHTVATQFSALVAQFSANSAGICYTLQIWFGLKLQRIYMPQMFWNQWVCDVVVIDVDVWACQQLWFTDVIFSSAAQRCWGWHSSAWLVTRRWDVRSRSVLVPPRHNPRVQCCDDVSTHLDPVCSCSASVNDVVVLFLLQTNSDVSSSSEFNSGDVTSWLLDTCALCSNSIESRSVVSKLISSSFILFRSIASYFLSPLNVTCQDSVRLF